MQADVDCKQVVYHELRKALSFEGNFPLQPAAHQHGLIAADVAKGTAVGEMRDEYS